MASNIGSLIVHLGADTATLQSDLGRANAIFQRNMGQIEKSAIQLGKVVGVGIAAATTAVTALVKNSISNADQLSELSQKVGISTESLSAMKYQAGLASVEISSLQTGLVRFSRTAADAAGGSKQQAALFNAMGISVKDFAGNLKPADGLLREVSAKFATYADGTGKAALATQLFGRAGADLIPMLNEGAEGMDAAAREAATLGQIISGETAVAANELGDNLDRLKAVATGFGNELAARLLPSLVGLTDQMVANAKASDGMASSADGVATSLQWISKAAIITKGAIEGLTNMVAASIDTLIGFSEIASGVLTNIGHATAGALLSAGGQFVQAKEQFDLAGQALGDGWEAGAGRIKTAWASASQGIGDAITNADSLVAAMDKPKQSLGQFSNVVAGVGPILKKTAAPLVEFGGAMKKVSDESAKFVEAAAERVAALQLEVDTFGQTEGAILLYKAANESLSETERVAIEGYAASTDALNAKKQALEDQKEALETLGANIIEQIGIDAAYDKSLLSMTGRQRAFSLAQKEANKYFEANKRLFAAVGVTAEQYANALGEAAAETFDATERANELERVLSQFGDLDFGDSLVDQIKMVGEELEKATDPEQVERLSRALEDMRKTQIRANIKAFLDLGEAVVGSMKDAATEGSRHYAALEVAQSALALGQGILAILTQGQGDPYSAPFRMAAMAAVVVPLVAQLGASITALGNSGFSDTAAQRQAAQGTGTVLGDATAKSESIEKAIEITADATTQLVGLNRGMLNALLDLKDALGAAGGLLARGAGEADFSGMNLAVGGAGSGLFDGKGILGRLLTGSSKITDQGIVIMGGALTGMLDSIMVGAYQEVQSRSWAFGSTQTNTGVVDVSDELGRQFQLVIGSIIDTVREGAEALGLLPADIQAAIEAFKVEEIKISFKDLDAEEQQAELEAVFSSIFDGLAGAVVPFIEQFQQVGEGLGETLVRIATEVQVAQEAFRQLGLVVNETDPERFAQISDSLIQAAGGLESFITGMQTFVASFSTDAYQFNVASQELASAFAQVGLAVPDTRDGMWELMQSLDATTEAGQEQIATLLRLASVADEYYSLLDDQAESFNNIGGDVEKFREAIAQIHAQTQASIDRANELARANGAEGASTEELVRIHERAAKIFSQVLNQLRQAAQALAFEMGLTNMGTSGQIEAEIARLEGVAGNAAQPIRDFGNAMRTAAQAATDAINLLLGDLSPLNDQEKLNKALEGLRAGTVTQEQVLQIGRRLYASTDQYNQLFAMVQQFGSRPSGSGSVGGVSPGQAGGLSAEDRARLESLYDQREASMAQQDFLNAQTLAGQIAEISEASGEQYKDVLEEMGISAQELAERLHLDNVDQLDAWVETFQENNDENTNVVADLLREILAAIRGNDPSSGRVGGGPDGGGRDGRTAEGNSRRRLTDEDAEAVGTAVGRAITGNTPRNGRTGAGAGPRGR